MCNVWNVIIGTCHLQVGSLVNTTTSVVPRDYFDFEKKFKTPGDTEREIGVVKKDKKRQARCPMKQKDSSHLALGGVFEF